MSMVWQAIQAVIVIFLMIGAGVFVSWRKWVSREAANVFPKLIINLSLPCTAVYSLYTKLSRELLLQSWLPIAIAFFVVFVMFFLSKLMAALFRIPKHRRGVFSVLFAFANTVFIGFPVVQALFGDTGMPYAVFYYLANTTFFWTLGYYGLQKDAELISGRHSAVSLGGVLKKLVSVPIVTVGVMYVVVLMDIRLPEFVLTTAQYIGGMTSPLSLLFMGCVIYGIGISGFKYERGIGPAMVGRFLIVPVFCFAVCTLVMQFVPQTGSAVDFELMRNVLTIQSAQPVMTQTVIMSQLRGADTGYAAKGVVWTTLFSLISIPVYMTIFQFI